MGLSARCAVMGEAGDTILRFHPLRFGMGRILMTPDAGKVYTVLIVLEDGRKFLEQLPAASATGITMSAEKNENQQVEVQVETSSETSLYLVAHTRGITKIALTANTIEKKAKFLVELAKLGDGISHLTLFDASGKPVCERLYFKQPSAPVALNVVASKTIAGTRDKLTVDLALENSTGQVEAANISMSVFQLNALQNVSDEDINSYLWLSSDLTGYIQSPGYYLNPGSADREEAVDNLMLTQGWRRFQWNEVMSANPKTLLHSPEITGHIVNGTVIDTRTNKPAADINGYVSSPGPYTVFRQSTSMKDGSIKFDLRSFYGGTELIAQTNIDADSVYRIDIKSPFSTEKYLPLQSSLVVRQQYLNDLLNQSISSHVQNVFFTAAQQQVFRAGFDSSTFYVNVDERYLLDNYTRFTTMEEVLREYVRSVNVRKRSSGFGLYVYDAAGDLIFEKNPLVLLDGVPVFNNNKVIGIDPLKIESIDVLSRRYFLGNTSYEGVVNMKTYRGDLGGYELDPNALVVDYEGLQMQRYFYIPDYNVDSVKSSHLPDYRNVISWNPDLIMGFDGRSKAEIFTSDLKGRFAIVVQGLTRKGKPVVGRAFIEVK